jgi:hypothetical protein
MDIIKIKNRLDAGEIVELHNGKDLATVSRSNITSDYLFVFNAKALFGLKTFKIFEKRAKEKIEKYSLIELKNERG